MRGNPGGQKSLELMLVIRWASSVSHLALAEAPAQEAGCPEWGRRPGLCRRPCVSGRPPCSCHRADQLHEPRNTTGIWGCSSTTQDCRYPGRPSGRWDTSLNRADSQHRGCGGGPGGRSRTRAAVLGVVWNLRTHQNHQEKLLKKQESESEK